MAEDKNLSVATEEVEKEAQPTTKPEEKTEAKSVSTPNTNRFSNQGTSKPSDRQGSNFSGNRSNGGGDRGPRRDGKFNKNDRGPRRDEMLYEEKVVTINRVTKVTKGGRRFRFAAVVVIGDKKGKVGLGTGKANEVPDAIKKAIKEAKKSLVKIPLKGTTVPHEMLGHYGAGKVLIKPARKGTGVIAGGPARAVIELAGVSDVYIKSLGSNTPINMIRATLEGLSKIRTADQIAKLRAPSNTKQEKEAVVKTTA